MNNLVRTPDSWDYLERTTDNGRPVVKVRNAKGQLAAYAMGGAKYREGNAALIKMAPNLFELVQRVDSYFDEFIELIEVDEVLHNDLKAAIRKVQSQ